MSKALGRLLPKVHNYQQGPYPADYSNMIMAESFREARKQAAFKAFNTEFSRNGYISLCHVFTEHNFPF